MAAEVQMPFDKEKAKRNIEGILEKFNADTDITLLHEYHKLYKKEVSLFKRSWAAAWLFMYYDKRETPSQRIADSPQTAGSRQKSKGKNTSKDNVSKDGVSINNSSINNKNNTSEPLEINLPEEESKRLFISIGKNRRLYPREVITLIMSKSSAAREDIGVIRILDNYSFVQVRDVKADEIIAALTGHKFRGRTLTVNYAKPKNSDDVSK
jgi:hypothetical protein